MYSKEINGWKPECSDQREIEQYREKQKDDIDARFYLADNMIAQASSGKETASAVWMMEEVAKENHLLAVFSMGQLFHYGWAVKQDNATAEFWYKKAAELGHPGAENALKELTEKKKPSKKEKEPKKIPEPANDEIPVEKPKKKKGNKKTVIIICIVLIIAAAVAAGVIFLKPAKKSDAPPQKTELTIKVGENTTLVKKDNANDTALEQANLKKQYDDEEVIRGDKPTNRLIVEYEGTELDLSDFKATSIVAQEGGLILIQFETAEETKRCREALEKMDGIVYVIEDTYEAMFNNKNTNPSASSPTVYKSSKSGHDYYSWGIKDLELDVFAEYLEKSGKAKEITVAVIDTGVEPNPITGKRMLEGIDMVEPDNKYGFVDNVGHGTHVAGTVFDATRGLDVNILPIGVAVGTQGMVSTSGVFQGIEYAVANGADVINMSLGGPSNSSNAGYSRLIKKAVNQGVVVVVAAGNESSDTKYFTPSKIDECIVVAAHESDHRTASFSNYGSSVDVSGPGTEIHSYCTKNYVNSVEVEPDVYVAPMQGTSMASPHIAALAAMLKMYVPNATPQQIEKYIKDYCENPGDELYYGAGICKAGLFIEK